jgi:endo-beta-N-acetylglucosaminidase D
MLHEKRAEELEEREQADLAARAALGDAMTRIEAWKRGCEEWARIRVELMSQRGASVRALDVSLEQARRRIAREQS